MATNSSTPEFVRAILASKENLSAILKLPDDVPIKKLVIEHMKKAKAKVLANNVKPKGDAPSSAKVNRSYPTSN